MINREDYTMLNAKVKELLNQQVNKEFYSAYLYLDFSNYYEARRSGITLCCSTSICTTTMKRLPWRLSTSPIRSLPAIWTP